MIGLLFKLMFFPMYFAIWLIVASFQILLYPIKLVLELVLLPFGIMLSPFQSKRKKRSQNDMGLIPTLGWCFFFHDLFD